MRQPAPTPASPTAPLSAAQSAVQSAPPSAPTAQQDSRPTLVHYLLVLAVSMLLWLLLAESLAPQELIAAAVGGVLVTVVAAPRLGIFTGMRFAPGAPVSLVRYLVHFFRALVIANLDVARRVLSPSLPIRPAVVEVKTELTSPLGRMLLANSITLTPGTLVIDVLDDRLLVHAMTREGAEALEEGEMNRRVARLGEG